MSAFLDKRVEQQTEHVKRMVAQFPQAKWAVNGLVVCVQDAERERIIELLLKLRTCTPTKGLCENCQQTEFCIDQIREEQA
jgi:hypothetical protein